MYVLITCKFKKDQININRENIATYILFLDTQGPKIKLIQTLMLITCKYEKRSNQKQPRKHHDTVFPIITLLGYSFDAQGQLTP